MYYHPERKLVYLAHGHTASRSTSGALKGQGFLKLPRENHHATLYESGIVTKENRELWHTFTTVRNHFDWILAQTWKIQIATHPGPEIDWSDLSMWESALKRHNHITESHLFSRHVPDSDTLLHFETLKKDLELIVGPIRLPCVVLNPQRGGNPRKRGLEYRKYYTPKVRKWVEDRYGAEMEELGYSW